MLQFIQCLLKMSLNDVNKLGTIAYQEVVHVKRAFHTWGYTFNDRVDFQCKECNREYAAVRDRDLGPMDHQKEMTHWDSNGHVTDDVT